MNRHTPTPINQLRVRAVQRARGLGSIRVARFRCAPCGRSGRRCCLLYPARRATDLPVPTPRTPAPAADQNWLLAAARRVGLLRKAALGAVHTLLVETPGGQQRTFRCVGFGGMAWVVALLALLPQAGRQAGGHSLAAC